MCAEIAGIASYSYGPVQHHELPKNRLLQFQTLQICHEHVCDMEYLWIKSHIPLFSDRQTAIFQSPEEKNLSSSEVFPSTSFLASSASFSFWSVLCWILLSAWKNSPYSPLWNFYKYNIELWKILKLILKEFHLLNSSVW